MSTPFRPRRDPRPDIEQALERAIELSEGNKRYPVTNGRLVYERHRRYRYAFRLTARSWDVPDGADLMLDSSDLTKQLPVELSNTKDDTVTITVRQRLTERTLASADLVVEQAFLLRKQKEAFLRQSTTAQLSLKLLGVLDSSDVEAEAHLIDTIREVFPADEAQQLAMRRALGSELLLILGPPGTGKTDVLAAVALLHATRFGHRVLIVSHTNNAVDTAVLRLAKFLRGIGMERFLGQQLLVRFGDPHLAELETDDYRNVTMPLIVADRVAHNREEVARLESKREALLGRLAVDREEPPKQVEAWQEREATLWMQRKEAEQALTGLEAEEQARLTSILEQLTPRLDQRSAEEETMKQARADWREARASLKSLQRTYEIRRTSDGTEPKKLGRLDRHQRLIRFFLQLWTSERKKELEEATQLPADPLNELAQQMDVLRQDCVRALDTYRQARRRRDSLAPTIAYWQQQRDARPIRTVEQQMALTRQIADLTQQIEGGNARIASLERDVASLEKEVAWLEDALARLDQQLADLTREAVRKVVEDAQVVAATLTGLYLNPLLLNQKWDVVILDEASIAPPPAVVAAGNCAARHFIVIGDPLQLPPVCTFERREWLVHRWLGVDIYTHGHYTLKEASLGKHHSVLLPYQGRMHTDICDLVRGPVYKGLLKDRSLQPPRPAFRPEPEYPVVLYDTGGGPPASGQKSEKAGPPRSNQHHVEIAVALARQVLADLPPELRQPEYIGILTPYRAQRNAIKERIQGTDLEIYCRVGTVHSAQGLEFGALIFDTVESPGLAIAPFLRGGWGSEAMRLLNVAVTRARHKLLIVANMPYIREQLPASSMLRIITELAYQKRHIPATLLA